jgi:hypothetical protein
MASPQSRLPSRWIVYPVAIAVAAFAVYHFANRVTGPGGHTVDGQTAQQTPFDLRIDSGRITALRTRLQATCQDGEQWAASWTPTAGDQVQFATVGDTFSTSQAAQHTDTDGIDANEEFVMSGSFTGQNTATGTVRLAVTFSKNGVSVSCDSGDVGWSVGTAST